MSGPGTQHAGRCAVVTGAGQGIGRAIALRLAVPGTRLALFDRDPAALERVVPELQERGAEASTTVVDIADAEAARKAVDDVVRDLGRVDALVNNAGVGVMSQFLDLEVEQWQRTLAVNLTGTFVLTQHVGRLMVQGGSGSIVNISSIAGKAGSANLADYCASKAGVISLTQSAAKALGPSGVRVNAVCPGLVWTPMWRETATWIGRQGREDSDVGPPPEDVYAAAVKAATPLGLPTTPEDVAAAVTWLLSDEARLVTGQSVNVDGGIEVH